MKNIVILGASGFLGSYLVKNLNLRPKPLYNIIPLTRDDLDLTYHDHVKVYLEKNNVNTVINCAFQGSSVKDTCMKTNLSAFLNFYNNSDLFDHYINIGSGAELPNYRGTSIENDLVNFDDFLNDDYASTKNVISRMCLEKENFTTLRLYGCFDRTEPNHRLFKKLINREINYIHKNKFDYISAKDFTSIVRYYIEDAIPSGLSRLTELTSVLADNTLYHKDMNCVYNEKYNLSDIVDMFYQSNDIERYKFRVAGFNTDHPYVGDGSKLASLPIALEGLREGLKNYV